MVLRIIDSRGFITSMLTVTIMMIAFGIVSPHITLKTYIEIGLFSVSLLTTSFMLSRSLGSLCTAIITSAVGARLAGLIALILWSISIYLYMSLPTGLYPAIKVIEGFSAGLLWPLMQIMIASSVEPGWRNRCLSIYFIVGSVMGYLGMILGGIIYASLGSKGIFSTALLITLAYALAYAFLAPETKHGSHEKRISGGFGVYTSVIKEIMILIPLIIIVGGINGLLKDYLMAYVKRITGYGEEMVRIVWSLAGYAGLGLSIIVSYIADATGSRLVLLVPALLSLTSLAAIPAMGDLIPLCITLSLIIVSVRIFRPLIRGFASLYSSRPDYAIALTNSIANVSAALIPLIIGFMTLVSENFIDLGLTVYGIASIIVLAIVFLAGKRVSLRSPGHHIPQRPISSSSNICQ